MDIKSSKGKYAGRYAISNVINYYRDLSMQLNQQYNWRGYGVDNDCLDSAALSMYKLKKKHGKTDGTQLHQIAVYLTHSELASFGESLYFSKINLSDSVGQFLYDHGFQSICFTFDGEGYVLFRFIINTVSINDGNYFGSRKVFVSVITDFIHNQLFR